VIQREGQEGPISQPAIGAPVEVSHKGSPGGIGLLISSVGAVGVWALLLCASSSRKNWEQLNGLFFWPTWPMFTDLHSIWLGCDEWSRGTDPLTDPTTAFNYPRVWLLLSKVNLQGLPFVPSALFLDATFLLCVVRWMRPRKWWEGVLVALLVWSPPARLAMERGNIDLIIFMILTVGLFRCRDALNGDAGKWGFPALALIATELKLYPLFVLGAGTWLSDGGNRARRWWGWALIAALVLLVVLLPEVIAVGRKTGQYWYASFGTTVAGDRLGHRLYDFCFGAGSSAHRDIHKWVRVFSTATYLVLAFAALAMGRRFRRSYARGSDGITWSGFWTAAAVYAGTFLLGANYCYRLVFLFLGLPFLLAHVQTVARAARAWARLSLVVVLLVIFSPLEESGIGFVVTQCLQWALALLFIVAVAAMAPRDLWDSFAFWRPEATPSD